MKYNHAEFSLTQKRAEITDEERRLIDEYIAAGKVKKIPTGKMAFAAEFVWKGDPNNKHGIGALEPVNKMTNAERLAHIKRQRFNPRNAGPKPETIQRRAEILRLYQNGCNTAQIARHLGISAKAVRNHRTALRKEGKIEKAATNGSTTQAELDERRENVRKMIRAGCQRSEICDKLGLSVAEYDGDRKYLSDKGLVPKRQVINGNVVWVQEAVT